ncbi:hypothetical protein CHS0354_024064 [Potamilus streckersoni]|uniref:Aminopeptidase n=1 Tax=Potamilus streckersoni TaxID=2493646 RepID=A0AAE0RZR1_9BIVA|nr:hypothetical protein CHS0354_024064 [Potamilus streckersoni]
MFFVGVPNIIGQNIKNNPESNHANKFEQLGTILPSPNDFRTASGAPGSNYWQQKVDYKIVCELDETNRVLTGDETITYFNQSPDVLTYLWLQLDENEHHSKSGNNYFDGSVMDSVMDVQYLKQLAPPEKRLAGLGVNIQAVKDAKGKPMAYTINQTMMRIDLPSPLLPKSKINFSVTWSYKIPDRLEFRGRGGYEYFQKDGNDIFTITQWYPRLCVYSDFQGWQNKQFTGRGEFALTFGDFDVSIKVPSDHVVAATGECENVNSVLTPTQLQRWKSAKVSNEPIEIVTLEEAKKAEQSRSKTTKTWQFKAKNIRDFAWGSSRKFVWDAMQKKIEGKPVMCMSFYAKEAYGLYRPYSTKVVAHALEVYSKFTIPYPYPVAQSVEALNGMEYPMICFNYGRTAEDGTYSEDTKNGMIGVIIHEYLAEQHFENGFPSRGGSPSDIVDYMRLPKNQLEPIMTNSENIIRFGPNAYTKPATALNILRETIMGRTLFDFAFKEYSKRWAFKHPTPADFFRTMEDASGVDLDWFWRGWFYDIEPVDISLDSVKYFQVNYDKNPTQKSDTIKIKSPKPIDDLSVLRNSQDASILYATTVDKTLQDFYFKNKPYKTKDSVVKITMNRYDSLLSPAVKREKFGNQFFYQLHFSNKGGLVMPIIIQWNFTDGTNEIDRIPAEIWRKNEERVEKVFIKSKEVQSVSIDPFKETADIDLSNNHFPKKIIPSKFKVFQSKMKYRGQSHPDNLMKRAKATEKELKK